MTKQTSESIPKNITYSEIPRVDIFDTGLGGEVVPEHIAIHRTPRVDIMNVEPRNLVLPGEGLTDKEKMELHLSVQRALRRHGMLQEDAGDPLDGAPVSSDVFDYDLDNNIEPDELIELYGSYPSEEEDVDGRQEKGMRLTRVQVALAAVAFGGYFLQAAQPGGIGRFF
jgi:hypothetical protein